MIFYIDAKIKEPFDTTPDIIEGLIESALLRANIIVEDIQIVPETKIKDRDEKNSL